MDAHFYYTEEIDIERLATDLVNVYVAQGYQAQQIGNKDNMLVQLKKGGDFEAILGMQAALSLTIQRTAGGVLAMIGQQKWLDKAAVGAVGIVALPVLWPLALTAGVGALRQASLANQVLNIVDGLVRQQRPNVQVGPVPAHLMPQVQQQWAPPPRAQTPVYTPPPPTLHCPSCNTPYAQGDTFCSGCGRSLTPQKTYCANCHAELKPGASFCPNCGSSTFQQNSPTQAPPPTVQTPLPQTPVYTPPPAPQTPTYTPPPASRVDPYSPTVAAQPQPQPYYVPPVTQQPSVVPQPKVTLMPTESKQEQTLTAPPQPQRPQTPYYVPSPQAQQAAAQAQTVANPPVPAKPIVAKPTSQPAFDPSTPWGSLIFADGNQVQLQGERATVGRSDHDVGGIDPEVDLSSMQGSDTVSRIHAVFEHIGSTYTLTDLNSTNATRINGKRIEPDRATPINDGDTLTFGKVTCTFKKLK
ncbi:MAG: FHA domain-containing protein [Chloroflexi bacterium]|nr:FHA domain-containing protein [Ktedonobacteraceae bacterium]MBV9706556.1 FHA domain-containing protein [Chloroflexota bacterium]